MEYDAKVENGSEGGDTRFKSAKCPCPDPTRCKFDKRVCVNCGKKERMSWITENCSEMAQLIRGGMPIARDELAWIQWYGIGELRRREGRV